MARTKLTQSNSRREAYLKRNKLYEANNGFRKD